MENTTVGVNESGAIYQDTYVIHRIAAPELLIVDRVVTPIWYLIGIIGNPISTKIWLSRKMRKTNTSAIYLGSIAIVHLVFIFLHIWMELLQAWGFQTYNRPVICELFMVLYITPQYLAPVLILGFTVERYIAVCHPFLKEKYCTVTRAVGVVLTLTSLAVMMAVCQAYIWWFDNTSGLCEIRKSAEQFNIVWTWLSEMLVFAVVPATVLVFNVLVILEIKRISSFGLPPGMDGGSRGSNQTSTITLLSVSFYLICTLLPATIVYAIQTSIPPGDLTTPPEMWSSDASWESYLIYYHIRRIIEEICFSNYACYCIIYYITSTYFRNEVKRMFSSAKCFISSRFVKDKDPLSQTYPVVGREGKTTMEIIPPRL